MGPWLHSAWAFLSYNQYPTLGPPGCLEGKRLPGPGSCLTPQDTPLSAQGLLEMVCGMQIKTTSTRFVSPWSHRNMFQSYVSTKVRTWLSEITKEFLKKKVKKAGARSTHVLIQVLDVYIHTCNTEHRTHSEH